MDERDSQRASTPIRVYLDSQDFIAFSKQPLPESQAALFEELVMLRETGVAEFGVSLFHIAEVLNPDSEGYETYQKHCGEVIYRLTGGAAFPILAEVLEGATYPNGGIWIPKVSVEQLKGLLDPQHVRRMVLERLRDHTSLTRVQRKMAAKPKKLAALAKQIGYELPPLLKMVGLGEAEFRAMLLEPYRMRRSFGDKLFRFLTDPRYYCEAIATVRPGDNPLRSILDGSIAKTQDSMSTLFRMVQESKQSSAKLEETLKGIRTTYALMYGPKSDKVRDIDVQIRKVRRRDKDAVASMALPLDDERFAYLRTYISGLHRVDREPSSSEAIDLVHLAYHTEVDLIRLDRRMAELVKDDPALREKIVPRLAKLPEAVRTVWKSRQVLPAQ